MSHGSSVSSFQKKGKVKVVSIPGTRPSLHNAQLLISTGLPSLDYLLGGGLAVGSLLIVEEDRYDVYSKLFLKYFLAEGVINYTYYSLANWTCPPSKFNSILPSSGYTNPKINLVLMTDTSYLLWRVINQNSCSSIAYDSSLIDKVDVGLWDGKIIEEGKGMVKNKYYWSLLQFIKKRIESGNLSTSFNKAKTNVMRIALHSLGSPLWGWEFSQHEKDHPCNFSTALFFYLRALVRSSFSIGMVTIPSHLFVDPALMSRLTIAGDFVVRLESFQGSEKETNPVFKDYHGLFHIVKLSALNSLVPPLLDSTDWVFRLKRRSLTIERLHLPPELSETVSRDQEETVTKSGPACMGGKLPKHLDF
ncbi:LOW QUALITY PROTEIN: elongator complex protein 4-like [Penaeus monodon]|uniref:LOW QUALITY PROTEIN: elongator complex protein 4-like n=1 Tax=Penaeus monodon TaxID=6687 RepID=UPI0018A71907|nr:LOW QUALITY PROTEIN: elongator complex protein 4-like [Penaeus monodon]